MEATATCLLTNGQIAGLAGFFENKLDSFWSLCKKLPGMICFVQFDMAVWYIGNLLHKLGYACTHGKSAAIVKNWAPGSGRALNVRACFCDAR